MSEDFIGGLHDDLVEAMDRYERRSPRGRLVAGRSPHLLRSATLARVAAAAAIIVALVAALRTFAPQPHPARPHVVGALKIGGQPIDAALADGSLWVNDFEGSVVQVDPGKRRVVRRIEIPGVPAAVAAGGGSVWLQADRGGCGGGRLVRIDASTGRIVSRMPLPVPEDQNLAVGGGGVWVTRGCHPRENLDRYDDAGTRTASVALRVGALAAAGDNLWVLGRTGTLTQLDARTGQILHRWPGLAPFVGSAATPGTNSLVADDAGVWILSPTRAAILHVEDDRVVQQIPVDQSARPVLAKAHDGLWIATGDPLGAHNRLIRIDPTSGNPTATVDLGTQRPIALIPTDSQLCVLTANGTIVFVES